MNLSQKLNQTELKQKNKVKISVQLDSVQFGPICQINSNVLLYYQQQKIKNKHLFLINFKMRETISMFFFLFC